MADLPDRRTGATRTNQNRREIDVPATTMVGAWRTRLLAVVFLAAVALFAWLGLRGRLDEVSEALRATSGRGVLGAVLLVCLGVLATSQVWLLVMRRLDAPLPRTGGLAVFFVGQLGKYLPGSVWAIGAQAALASPYRVPVRTTLTAGLVFLGYHVATAGVVAAASILGGALTPDWPRWVTVLGLAACLVGLLPGVVRALAERFAGRPAVVTASDTLAVLLWMTLAWSAYAAALVLLTATHDWSDLVALGGAFAASYAVGVVVVFAPAGLGARETVFVVLATPLLGLAPATALALLARVVHTVVDAAMAGGWWLAARAGRRAGVPG
jgi:uncharacterized membrane protein YbhN (UPF0104 family)